jgi:putative Mg2+ transporter-C (MgtC) family protein
MTLFENPQVQDLISVAIACLLGSVVGIEREKNSKPAGLRTHIIVAGSSALLVCLGSTITQQYISQAGSDNVIADPTRILHAIIVGISFLGAGTILKVASDQRVRYLTTAASLLFSGGIGAAAAMGQYILAAGSALLALFINLTLGWFENLADQNSNSSED